MIVRIHALALAAAGGLLAGCSLVANLSQFDSVSLATTAAADGGNSPSPDSGSGFVDAGVDSAAMTVEAGPTPEMEAGKAEAAVMEAAAQKDVGAMDADMTADATESGDAADDAEAVDGAPPMDAGPTNLVINPGFEQGTAPWTTYTDSSGHSALVATSMLYAHSGSFSGWVSNRTATFQSAVQDITLRVVQGHTYTMSAWSRIELPDGGVDAAALADVVNLTAKISCVTDAGLTADYVHAGSGSVASGTWTETSGSFVVPVCTLVSVEVYVEGPAVGEDLFVDDVSVLP